MEKQTREWLRIAFFIATFLTIGLFQGLVIPEFRERNVGVATMQWAYLLSTTAFILLWGALLFYEAKCNFEGKPIRKFRNGEKFKVSRQLRVGAEFFLELAKFDNTNDTRFYHLSPVDGKLFILDEKGKVLKKFPDAFRVEKWKKPVIVFVKDKDRCVEYVKTVKAYSIIPIASS